jgi:Na+/H+ antiporter NhaC
LEPFGFLAAVPFILALVFVFWQEDVIFPLLGGLFIGSIIFSKFNPFFGFLNITDVFIVSALTDNTDIFVLFIIAEGVLLFSLLNRGGYLNSIRREYAKKGLTTGLLQYIIALAGALVFVDRYLSSLLVGLFSKPFAEKKKLPPEKHAFILNTLSSSLSTLIPLTTLTPLIIAGIGSAFGGLGIDYSPFSAFYRSLPFQFYNIFSVFILFSTIILNKELFFMRAFNGSALSDSSPAGADKRPGGEPLTFDAGLYTKKQSRIDRSLAATGALLLVFGIIAAGYIINGRGRTPVNLLNMEMHLKIFIGALFTGIIYVILFSLISRNETYDAYKSKNRGISHSLLVTFLFFLLAMSIEALARKLELPPSLIGTLLRKPVSPGFLPLIFFLFSSCISFLCGSPVVTIAAVIPFAVRTVSSSLPDPLLIESTLFASVGAVVSGASFGDINSPFSINFIVSAAAAETTVNGHFKSQIGYSLLAFGVASIFGYLLFAAGVKPYLSIAAGLFVIGASFLFLHNDISLFKRIN